MITFQVNRLRHNIPEAERQSGSKNHPQLSVREPQQQEKGEKRSNLCSHKIMTSQKTFFLTSASQTEARVRTD